MREALHEMSAGALACGVARREVSAREIAAHFLECVEQLNPAIDAICTVNPDAVAEAEACDRRLQSGEKPRPLEGVPFVAKDNLQTKGLRTTFGSLLCENYVPEEDAIAIERLRGGRRPSGQDQHAGIRDRREHDQPALRTNTQPA